MIGTWGTAFLLGLLGGAHCIGMCGPLALALAGGPATRGRFLAGRCLYNAGRVVTYTLLGLPFGLFGQALQLAGWQRGLSIGAGVVVLLGALAYAGIPGGWHPPVALASWSGGFRRLWGRLLSRRSAGALFGIGLLNGLLPCGLVYAALAAAAATGNARDSALFMFAFGLGTFPVMLAISLAGRLAQAGVRRVTQPLVPIGLALMAGLLILRGLGLGIPYLSPAFAEDGESSCCHHNSAPAP